jgi:hypothetical protein
LLESLRKKLGEKGFREKDNFAISAYPSAERYQYLVACDAGLCLTIAQEFKTDMLYLKIVDFWGAGLPVIVNQDVSAVADIVRKSGAGAVVDYADWDRSVAQIEPSRLFQKTIQNPQIFAAYSSVSIIPQYLDLFARAFHFFG